jgi:hypothetical protein
LDPGSGWVNFRIRDKHPGSATLRKSRCFCGGRGISISEGGGGTDPFPTKYNTNKKESQIFLIYNEIQSGAVATIYMYDEGLPNIRGNAQRAIIHSEFPYI